MTWSTSCSFASQAGIESQHRRWNVNRALFRMITREWFSPVWTDVTGQLRRDHPAPFPLEVPRRLIRMFSFAGDIVVDPFAGTGTTALAALEVGRSSISVEIEPAY